MKKKTTYGIRTDYMEIYKTEPMESKESGASDTVGQPHMDGAQDM